MTVRMRLPADYEAFDQIQPFLMAAVSPCPAQLMRQIQLAVHELCLNIVQHAYGEAGGDIIIEVRRNAEMLEVSIRDYAGGSYNPLQGTTWPDPQSLPEHGWGMVIVHQVMDSVAYQRVSDGNLWVLSKRIPHER